MKMMKFLPALAVLATGCTTEIKAPVSDFPVFGPYMTAQGNLYKNPLSWSAEMPDAFLTWDADHAEYVLVRGSQVVDRRNGDKVMVWHHAILADILQSSSCSKWAYDPNGKDGVWGPLRDPAIVKDADGKWRLYATALGKKDDESTRREAVFEAEEGRAWSAYSFKHWSATRTVKPSAIFGFECRGLITPSAEAKEIRSVTPFKSPDGKELWLTYTTVDEGLAAKQRAPIICIQKAKLGADGKPVPTPADPFGKWKACPSGEPPITVTR